mmetsp:Transcript_26590/g.37450  ORF Transcript_26590/g.37450 Transcript_26590/m.37450 type:complete len:333 (-) Transcript_26590:51-1049(-)
MRLSVALALLATFESAASFVPVPMRQQQRAFVALNMVEERRPPTPEEIVKRARKAAGLPEDEEEPPKLFEDDILDDFQQSLIKLEKRVKEGPGSLSAEEVNELDAATQRIVAEMKEKLANDASPQGASSSSVATPAAKVETVPPPPVAEVTPPPPKEAVSAAVTSPSLYPNPVPEQPKQAEFLKADDAADKVLNAVANKHNPVPESFEQVEFNKAHDAVDKVTDTSQDEGPVFDGTGGMGQPRGTRNTYAIPGMDAMSPEEYRDALQKSVIDAQRKRRQQYGGMVGNRASHSYLNQLGWGGATENLAGTASEGAKDVTESFDFDSYQTKKSE